MLDIHSQNDPFKVLTLHGKHCLDFSFVFSALLPAWRNLFSASKIFCSGRYQPSYTGIFWPAEGTSQPFTIYKKWKNPSSALLRKRTWIQAIPPLATCCLSLLASGTDLKSQKGLYWGPSPIHNNLQLIVWTRSILQHICSFLQSGGGFQKLQPSGVSNLSLVCGWPVQFKNVSQIPPTGCYVSFLPCHRTFGNKQLTLQEGTKGNAGQSTSKILLNFSTLNLLLQTIGINY
jgi:hypothetical protein